MRLQVLHSSFKGVIRPLKIYDVFWTHEPQGVCLFHVFKSSVSSPVYSSFHLSGPRSVLTFSPSPEAVLASPEPCGSTAMAVLKITLGSSMSPSGKWLRLICCLCFCIMDEGSMKNEKGKEAKKKENSATFLVLWWMNLMSLIHTAVLLFFLLQCFSCSLSALCQTSLYDTFILLIFWSLRMCGQHEVHKHCL